VRVGIDASNLRAGGGRTHLAALLGAAAPGPYGITHVTVWGARDTLAQLPRAPWLTLTSEPALEGGLVSRLLWQRFVLARRAARTCDVLFVPGGSYSGPFRPFVTMSRSLLPFQSHELRRYGRTPMTLKLWLLRLGQTATVRRADGVIFLNDYARRAVLEVTGPPSGATVVVPHGVHPAFFLEPRPQRSPAEFGPGRPFRLLYVSTVDMYKHQWHVVEAVAALRAQNVPVSIELAGAAYAPALARLRAAIAKADPAGAFVSYAGPLPHASLARRYHEADAFVFASTCENMPNILLEAMAAGLPIACADRGPMPSVLGDGGVYFDPEQPESLTAAIGRLFANPALRAQLAGTAHQRARSYSWATTAERTWSFLAEVYAAHGARRRARDAAGHGVTA
jgi:glycosyltransferase involved in cell wall biosynthesis